MISYVHDEAGPRARRRLAFVIARCLSAVSLALGAGLLSAAAPAVAAASSTVPATAWTVTLTADYTNVPQGMTVRLTAHANHDVGPSNLYVVVFGPNYTRLCSVASGTGCAVNVTSATETTKGYIAEVAGSTDGSNSYAVSSTVTVTWGPAWAVTLDAVLDDGSNLNLAGGAVVQGKGVDLMAAANYDLDGYNLKVLDSSNAVVPNWATSATPASKTYHAVVQNGSDPTPVASSDPLTVTWTPAFTVTLTSNAVHGTATAGSSVTLTATANQDVGTTIYDIVILDSLNVPIGHCGYGKTCTATPWTQKAGSFTYHALVAVMSYLNTEQAAASYPYLTVTYTPGAATQFGVVTTSPSVAGAASNVTVSALDKYGNVVTGFTSSIHFTSTDAKATLPGDYTLVSGDHGTHTFPAGLTLKTAGSQTVRATQFPLARDSITGSQGVIVTPAAASTLTVSGLTSPRTAGTAGTITVTAKDAYGNTATGYTGTVHFTSTDAVAVLPADCTFTAANAGTHLFSVTLKTAGAQAVRARDTVTSTITGVQNGIVVNPAAAATLAVSGIPSPYSAGGSHSVTVTAKDAYGNTATGYLGTIHFTSTDAAATLPADYTFTAGDAGVHKFLPGLTLVTPGTQAVRARDTVTSTITGIQNGIVVS